MQYYDPNDRRPRRWAMLVTICYGLLLVASFAFVSFDFARPESHSDVLYIEFIETEPLAPPPPPPQPSSEVRTHTQPAPVEQVAQTSGEEPETRTPNAKALFQMNKAGADEPENAGNPHAPEGAEQNRGQGSGLRMEGMNQLDRGLQGRGLVGDLPRPAYPGTQSGKVVVRVMVDAAGKVTSAEFEPKGSTTNDPLLIEAATRAARAARFTESAAMVQGGTITYLFNIEA